MIRPIEEHDVSTVLEVWYQASLIAHPFLSEAFLAEEKTKLRDVFLPQSQTWVYVADGEVVGFASLVGNEVGGIFIRPSHQKQGIGTKLMNHVCQLCNIVELEVFEANKSARAFYARYGFTLMHSYHDKTTGQTMLRLQFNPTST